jgi:hypothetical protein
MAKYESELRALEGLGLDDIAMDDALTYLSASCRLPLVRRPTPRPPGRTARWTTRSSEPPTPLLAHVLDERSYPFAIRGGTAAGSAHDSAHRPITPTASG